MTHVTRTRHLWTVSLLLALCCTLVIILALLQYDKLRHPIDVTLPIPPAATTSLSYLGNQEVIIITGGSSTEPIILPVTKTLFEYVEIKNSCSVHFVGDCVVARTGPGLDFPVTTQLRNDIVLRVGGQVDHDGHTWYKIIFDEYVRYPERIQGGTMYVAADNVNVLMDEGEKTTWTHGNATNTKHIVVDRATQTLRAYDGDILFMETSVSTELELSPTIAGTFTIYKKTPSRYMQGPLPGFTDVYDLPGVPWNLYFTADGAVIHGTYWHDSFGTPYSHGCVNLLPIDARKLYNWAPLGTQITVR